MNFIHGGWAQLTRLDRVGQFCFIQFHVAAYNSKDEFLIWLAICAIQLGHHKNRFGRLSFRNLQELRQRDNRRHTWRVDPFNGQCRAGGRFWFTKRRNLAISAIATGITDHERIFANRGQGHKFVRHCPTHHAGIALNRYHFQPTAVKNIKVGLVDTRVEGVQPGKIEIEGVGILHCKLAHTNGTGPWAWLVAELSLDLVEHKGQLPIAAHNLAR